jgi:hypothetical protein
VAGPADPAFLALLRRNAAPQAGIDDLVDEHLATSAYGVDVTVERVPA